MKKANLVDWPQRVIDEIRDQAASWNSDWAKIGKVVDRLRAQGCKNATWLVDEMVRRGMLYMPRPGFVAVVPVTERARRGVASQ